MRHLAASFVLLVPSILFSGCVASVSGCGVTDSNTYTLYRSSLVDGSNRIHIASFDTKEGDRYNEENCRLAAELFQQQPGVRTRFYCEKGRYRK